MNPTPQPTPAKTASQEQAPARAPYTPPQVQDLGPWQAVTLIYSVPIAPRSGQP